MPRVLSFGQQQSVSTASETLQNRPVTARGVLFGKDTFDTQPATAQNQEAPPARSFGQRVMDAVRYVWHRFLDIVCRRPTSQKAIEKKLGELDEQVTDILENKLNPLMDGVLAETPETKCKQSFLDDTLSELQTLWAGLRKLGVKSIKLRERLQKLHHIDTQVKAKDYQELVKLADAILKAETMQEAIRLMEPF